MKKLKERIKSLSGKQNEDKIKQDLEEIEIINIELDHRVTKLIDENEHLKQTYKQLYDSIKPTRIRSKEQCDDLVNQVNLKSVEISDLNASFQEKVLVITALKDDLRKLKGKALVDNDVTKHPSDPQMLKIDVEPITPKLSNKQTAHSAYIKHTQEEATILRDLVEHVKSKYPLDQSLESACRITTTTKVPLRKPTDLDNETSKPVVTLVYSRKPRKSKTNVPVSRIKGFLKILYLLTKRNSVNLGDPKFLMFHLPVLMNAGHPNCSLRYYEKIGISIKTSVRFSLYSKMVSLKRRNPENLGKLQPKADIGIFIGYAPTKKAFRIYNRRTRRIIETIHVDFDELTAMASEHSSLGPALHEMTPATISSGLVPNPPPSTPDW
ncbi:hypothetical protein Tco_1191631 [Tanacetum coccineum]